MKERLGLRTPTKTDAELETAYGLGLLRKEELIHGTHYRGTCRNAEVARWHAGAQRFAYVRHKFGNVFLEKICHPLDDRHFDVFLAVEAVTMPAVGRVEDDAFERLFATPAPRGSL